jgi:ATP-dependent RNA helicase DeaD
VDTFETPDMKAQKTSTGEASDAQKAPAPTLSFSDLGLSLDIVQHLESMNFKVPTPIQVQTIPQLLKMDGDFIGLAPTGTGKTAAFGLPLVQTLDPADKSTQALILCPTRELALQVSAQIQSFGTKRGLRTVTIYGGASYRPQVDGVKRGAQIIIATPGRLVDMLDQKIVKLGKVKTVILDEADEMVSMGFKDDLERILRETQSEGESPRTWLFSATMSPGVRIIAQSYLKTTGSVEIKGGPRLSELIQQCHYAVYERDKAEVLVRVLQTHEDFYGLIFCQTKAEVAELARVLTSKGFPAEAIHGDKTQADREKTLSLFKRRQVKALVATDVAARGLDIKDLTHVVNYSLPWEVDTYVHRIGRTGRNGQKGIALNLIAPNDVRGLHRIQSVLKVQVPRLDIPSAKKLGEQRLEKLQGELVTAMNNEKLYTRAKELLGLLGAEGPLSEKTGLEILAATIVAFNKDMLFQKEIETFTTEAKSRGGFARGSGQSRGPRSYDRGGDRGSYDRGPSRGGFDRSAGPRRFDRGGPRSDDRGPRTDSRGPRTEDRAPQSFDRPARFAGAHIEDRAPRAEIKREGRPNAFASGTGFRRNEFEGQPARRDENRRFQGGRPARDTARW